MLSSHLISSHLISSLLISSHPNLNSDSNSNATSSIFHPPRLPSLPEGEGAAPLEPALPPLHPLRPRGRLGGRGGWGERWGGTTLRMGRAIYLVGRWLRFVFSTSSHLISSHLISSHFILSHLFSSKTHIDACSKCNFSFGSTIIFILILRTVFFCFYHYPWPIFV